ncbi:MAG TPA: DNA-3-methyladenine glycosylase 2 family protein [Candidatus Scatavimonas merdigallinarum]|uniref:DNA-(apurinic or apyrimidinic site) lyase n=1 Tax=Candidatus Scatavimonas merdigallinarum TaxID=2840914 RepID=A0A9D0ZI73_9FIRM|nr:DNA-3-methyladenine glycosylase 2 family protein [Candidatus Scatavimonas merdigallinarum]
MEKERCAATLALDGVQDLVLSQTLDCGQCFRWEAQPDGSFSGQVFGGTAQVRLEQGTLYITDTACRPGAEQAQAARWRRYFDLELDYGKIRASLSRLHPVLKAATDYAPGIRILRQEPWEALCSFILSQNSHIPRIKGMIHRLCALFGEQNGGAHTFPRPEALALCTVEDLTPIRSGFRAKYLLDAAQKVAGGQIDLQAVSVMELEQARQVCMQIRGVGPKVADCTLLYGMHRLECFPMDVWMKRAMETLLPGMHPSDFGEYAGIAQQYIFHYSRTHPALFTQAI